MKHLIYLLLPLMFACSDLRGRDFGTLSAQSAVNDAEKAAVRAEASAAKARTVPDQMRGLLNPMQQSVERSNAAISEGEKRLKNLGARL